MSVYDIRDEWLKLADDENKLRLELIKLQEQKSKLIAFCVEQADRLSSKALLELTPDGTRRTVSHTRLRQKDYVSETDVESVASYVNPSRRKCGLCKEPGHRADNCPNAHKIVKKEKRKVSPERRAQLAENLKKARAARKEKT